MNILLRDTPPHFSSHRLVVGEPKKKTERKKTFEFSKLEFFVHKSFENRLICPVLKIGCFDPHPLVKWTRCSTWLCQQVELERKVETLTSSKAHYKQEWGRALKELFKLKQAVQSRQEAEMRKQQQQLEHMRLVHLAAEERKVAHKEKDEIEELKLEISKLVWLFLKVELITNTHVMKLLCAIIVSVIPIPISRREIRIRFICILLFSRYQIQSYSAIQHWALFFAQL